MRADFLIRNGWEPVHVPIHKGTYRITMWRDPLPTLAPGGGTHHRVLWPHEAEFRAERRIFLVRRVMED
jgi:hypothetical protein